MPSAGAAACSTRVVPAMASPRPEAPGALALAHGRPSGLQSLWAAEPSGCRACGLQSLWAPEQSYHPLGRPGPAGQPWPLDGSRLSPRRHPREIGRQGEQAVDPWVSSPYRAWRGEVAYQRGATAKARHRPLALGLPPQRRGRPPQAVASLASLPPSTFCSHALLPFAGSNGIERP